MKALIFDLDGTLIDSVYAQVLAWQKSFELVEHLAVPAWRLHEKIGLDGMLLAPAIARELGRSLDSRAAVALDQRHSEIMKELLPRPSVLPGAVELLHDLRVRNIPHGIATSNGRDAMRESLRLLSVPTATVIVCADVKDAKPEPDLFVKCSERLGISANNCFAVGDAVWDMLAARRARMLGVGLLSGGRTEQNLAQAGAYRIYRDPEDLHQRLFELGIA
jgi:HAD superfamily hydrolase (TIGR01509 family)